MSDNNTKPTFKWIYPEFDEPAPRGKNLLLLTDGGTPTIGIWGPGFIAWADYPERDITKEPQPYYKNYGRKP